MSDIKNLHRAYAAVYDSEIKENLKQSRDEISAMSLTQMNDVDLYEINEAFAVVALTAIKELKLNSKCVNINGGAVSMGHPIGASGARIMCTLLNALINNDKKLGVSSICIGGGEALSMLVERI